METLTALETQAFDALHEESKSNGHDFGLLEYVVWEGNRKQLGGLVTSLHAKGVIVDVSFVVVDDRKLTQYVLSEEAKKARE